MNKIWGIQVTVTTLAGRYKIISQLGGGGFAITFLAKDIMQPSQPLCVVKQLHPYQTQPRVIELFHQEAAILEKLGKHPQIPHLLAHFQQSDNLYIVQEFIKGQDLTNEIFSGERLSEDYVRNLLKEVLEVLSFVHQQGVIHRDIKPQNLMRREEDGRIFLIDFGAVKELGTLVINTQGEIASSVAIGTPGYMSNEQGLGKPCFASDIYALGMTAIHALTGIPPSELEENPQTGEVIWLDKAEVSQELATAINKMVRRHFSLRYSSALDVLQVINPVEQSTETTLQVPPISEQPANPKPQELSELTTIAYKRRSSLKRRKFIQTMGLVGGGFVTAILGQRILQANFNESSSEHQISDMSDAGMVETPVSESESSSLSGITLESFDFTIVTVDDKGSITNRKPGSAKYFGEDLGNGVILEMVEIPGGEFLMGSPEGEKRRKKDESPQHKVNLKPFFMGKFAVTQAQYQAIMGKNPSIFKQEERPVESVNWNDGIEFCRKLSEKTGRTYRLPSEAEWEYACRAGSTTPFFFGETITSNLANYNSNSTYGNAPKAKFRRKTTEVGSFPPNAFGLYDMHGNVWEWCQDNLHKNYINAPNDGSVWTKNGNNYRRMLRGGSWKSHPSECRSAYRNWSYPDVTVNYYGFRVVCDVG